MASGNGDHSGMRKRYTAAFQAELVKVVADGEASTAQAAARLGVAASTAYKWMRQARICGPVEERAEQPIQQTRLARPPVAAPKFARLVRAAEPAAKIELRVAGVAILVGRGFDGELLRRVVEALAGDAA